MNKTSNLKRNIIKQKQTSDKYVRMIKEVDDQVGGSRSGTYVDIDKLNDSMVDPTVATLETATEAAKDGIELLQTFVKLADSEKKRMKTYREVYILALPCDLPCAASRRVGETSLSEA